MSAFTVRVPDKTAERLDHIGAYFAQGNPEAAARVISRILIALDATEEPDG